MRNALLLALVVVAIGAGVHFGFQLTRAGKPAFVIAVAIPYLALGLFAVIRAYRDGVLLPYVGEEGRTGWLAARGGDVTIGILSAVALVGAAWGFSKVVTPVGTPRESWFARVYLQLGDPSYLREHVTTVVAVILVMAFLEEIVWRGLVVDLVSAYVGTQRAWIASAFLYALAHVPTAFALRDPVAGPNPVVVLGALAVGLVWGFMARRLGRLVPGMISHAAFDWAILMMFRLWGDSI